MVAMTPLIAIQVLGLIYKIRSARGAAQETAEEIQELVAEIHVEDDDVIDL
jgi:hypothetical protein